MFKNYLKIAWRNITRQKQFTFLNILGLTLGIACCLMIGLYVHSEMTYDTFHEKRDRIYRVNQSDIWSDWNDQLASTGPNVAVALRADIPEFEEVTRILNTGDKTVRNAEIENNEVFFKEENFFVAEENFFEVFSFQFIKGNPQTALNEPTSLVITQETANRYFGDANPMGKLLEVRNTNGSWESLTVTAVIENVPAKSHLQFDMLVSLNSLQQRLQRQDWLWVWTGFSTYGLVKQGTDIASLSEKIQAIPPKWAALTTERVFNQPYEEFTSGKKWKLHLEPLSKVYLSNSPGTHSFGPNGNPQFVRLFGAIGILILFLSSINFMNLSTARSSKRAKEVGVRKVLGSARKRLINQFILESTLFVVISTIIALLVVQVSLSGFNTIAEKQLSLIPLFREPLFLITLFLFMALLGVLAGSYPAFYLSAFKPIQTLKGKLNTGFKGKNLRNSLVVFQFTISIALIICAFFVQKQLKYTSSIDLGLSKDNVLQIHNLEQLGSDAKTLKTKMKNISAFSHVGISYGMPPNVWSGDKYRAFGPDNPAIQISDFRTEGDYLDLLGLDFIAGRNFNPNRSNDKYGVILNEEAVKIFGWGNKESYVTDSPVGKYVALTNENADKLEVLGVVKDFNFSTVKEKIGPLVILHQDNDKIWNYGRGRTYLSARIDSNAVNSAGELQLLINDIENEIAEMDSSILFEYSFMDQEFESTFKSETRMGVVLNIFTILALIIACLGLFGLAAFSAEQRVKELGIRKVLGAKLSELLLLFTSEFAKLIMISVLLASAISYFLVDEWLTNFAYRTQIDLWVFIIAAICAFIITVFTVSFQAMKAANANPVESLRME